MKLRREYSLLEVAVLVFMTNHLWNLGVVGGSSFWFWTSLVTIFVFLIPHPDYWRGGNDV